MEFTPELVIAAYSKGYFPMAENKNEKHIDWFCPQKRAVFFPEQFHVPRSLLKFINKKDYKVRLNRQFSEVIRLCRDLRSESWINDKIIEVYTYLHKAGFVHSVEVYYGSDLAGGLYGVQIGGVFFGESLFYLKSNASKIALYELIQIMKRENMSLLDIQFKNEFLQQFGICEIDLKEYIDILDVSLCRSVNFTE